MLAYKCRLYPDYGEEQRLLYIKEVSRRVYNQSLELYNVGEHDRFNLQALLPV